MQQFTPILLALTSAVLFAISILVLHQGLRHTDSETGSLVQIGATTLCFWLLAPWLVESWYWFTPAALMFAIIGLFKPFVSANASLLSVHYLGPTPTATLAATSPLFAAAFAVLLLDERLTLPIVLGTVAIMAGSIALAQRGKGAGRGSWPLWALGLPLLAAFVRATGDGLTKYAMIDLPSPHFAGLVSFSVSLIVATAVYGARRRTLPKLGVRFGTGWFVLAGTINGVSVYFLNTALQLGELIVVVPIVSSSPIITLLLSAFLVRRENITRNSLLAVFLVVPGVIIIALGR
ncbi:MAG: DMT family transporter [Rhodospirillaceae bacterium]|nr:DMT family transporter [Rhodospirillaceae bacterium]MBT5191027.1 DMT family transporter [Rhodospirillaceae bacterium]MBT5896324.1 DMT family transporter [Rhodospirillaceae bacterium]MBT6426256.1 DMT family transporter [Rhodospirillaceae bacterium]MBT7758368.1 DMT family transporter [Rhodospirillaceae bacterium]